MTEKLFKSLKLCGLGSSVIECYLMEIVNCFEKFYNSEKITIIETEAQHVGPVTQQEPPICNINKLASGIHTQGMLYYPTPQPSDSCEYGAVDRQSSSRIGLE